MAIEMKIIGDSIDDIDKALSSMIRLDARSMPLDDLVQVAQSRLGAAGFAMTVEVVPEPAHSPVDSVDVPAASPPAKPKRTRLPKAVKAAVNDNDEDDESEGDVVEPTEEQLEADRAYVLDQLGTWFGDPAKKKKTKEFIDRIASRNNGIRMSLLDPKLFPAIRREMNTEFGVGGNGAGN